MDGFSLEAIRRVPLAEAVMLLFRSVTAENLLSSIWDEHRGRCYDRVISFPTVVHLISDALLVSKSGRQSFQHNMQQGVLEASVQAAYQKLAHLPIEVSEAFLERSTAVLRKAFPEWSAWQRPKSLQEFRIVTYDGKAIKKVARRLKPLRGTKGGLIGGRALVALDWDTNMATTMHGESDGEANEVKHTGTVVQRVNQLFPGLKLHVGDRAFCDLVQPRHFMSSPGDHFLVRYHKKVTFNRDLSVDERVGATSTAEHFTESHGWLGSEKDPRRLYVRRIELTCSTGKPVILITSLLDADKYAATDLLWVYRQRWGIEQMFQQVTEVFGLSHLIGTTPKATLFQFSFCMLLYNMMQVVRGYVAQSQSCEPSVISSELMFRDVEDQLIAWETFVSQETTNEYIEESPTMPQLRRRLGALLNSCWKDSWKASSTQSVHNSTRNNRNHTHTSVHRLLFGVPPKTKRTNLASKACQTARKQTHARPLQQ